MRNPSHRVVMAALAGGDGECGDCGSHGVGSGTSSIGWGHLVCRVVRAKGGDRTDVFQRDWLERDDLPGGRRKKLRTIWYAEEVGSTDTAVAELKELLGHVFESPKPTGLVRRLLGTMPETHGRLVVEDGWKPVYRIRTQPNRVVYTLAGDYPVPGPLRRD